MSRKVFVSYKYKDMSVKPLKPYSFIEYLAPGFSLTRVYVDFLADKIELSDHIYKGEESNNDLSGYSDEYIEANLKERRTSHTNALLAVVLPDVNGSYDYCIYKRRCCPEQCTWHNTDWLFEIMRRNTFNRRSSSIKPMDVKICDNQHERIHYGEFSYMPIVTWKQFIESPTKQIERVCDIRDNHIDEYDIQKVIQS